MYAFIASEAWERGTAATKLVEACLDCCVLGDMISPLVYIRKLLHSLRLELPKTLQINMAWLHWSLVLLLLFLWNSFLRVANFYLKKWAPHQPNNIPAICQVLASPRSLPNEETKSAFEMKKQDLGKLWGMISTLLKLHSAQVAFGGKPYLCITAPLKASVVWYMTCCCHSTTTHRIHRSLVVKQWIPGFVGWVTARCFGHFGLILKYRMGGPKVSSVWSLKVTKALHLAVLLVSHLFGCGFVLISIFWGRPLQQWQQRERQSRPCSCVLHDL